MWLGISVILYLIVSILIGIWASFKVKTGEDFILAGRSLPLHITTAALFATWFGSETVLGASSVFYQKGIYGIIEDPFGASLCLIILGVVFVKPLYKMNVLTFGDFYREKFGPTVELLASVLLIVTYIGWIAGQFVALGLIFESILGIPFIWSLILGASVVVAYTYLGGMWSVSITDFFQMIIIIVGLIICLIFIGQKVSFKEALNSVPSSHFDFFRKGNAVLYLNYIAMWMTIGLGSLPQQDIFQRVMSSKSVKVAQWGSVIAGLMYLTIAMIPIALVLYAKVLLTKNGIIIDEQHILPQLILQECPLWVQVMFFGALLSAVMSTASGALLAPSTILSENIFNHFIFKSKELNILKYSRLSVLILAIISFFLAFQNQDIYQLVAGSNALSLVGLFVPLTGGLFFKRFGQKSALASIILGILCWGIAIALNTEVSPLIYGLTGSLIGGIFTMIYTNTTVKDN